MVPETEKTLKRSGRVTVISCWPFVWSFRSCTALTEIFEASFSTGSQTCTEAILTAQAAD